MLGWDFRTASWAPRPNFSSTRYVRASPQGSLHQRPRTSLFKSHYPWPWKDTRSSLRADREKADFISAVWSVAPECLWNTQFFASLVRPCTDPSLSGEARLRGRTGSRLCSRTLCFRSARWSFLPFTGPCKAQRCMLFGNARGWRQPIHRPRPQSLLSDKNARTVEAVQVEPKP